MEGGFKDNEFSKLNETDKKVYILTQAGKHESIQFIGDEKTLLIKFTREYGDNSKEFKFYTIDNNISPTDTFIFKPLTGIEDAIRIIDEWINENQEISVTIGSGEF